MAKSIFSQADSNSYTSKNEPRIDSRRPRGTTTDVMDPIATIPTSMPTNHRLLRANFLFATTALWAHICLALLSFAQHLLICILQ